MPREFARLERSSGLGSSEMYILTSDAIQQETPQVEFANVEMPRKRKNLYKVDFPRGFQKLISQGGLQMLITQLATWCWGLCES